MHISFHEDPKGWLIVSHKPPSSCRRQNPRRFCSHASDLQMPMWFWQSACFLCQETYTWNDEPPKLPQRLSDFHDLRVVKTSLQAIVSNMKMLHVLVPIILASEIVEVVSVQMTDQLRENVLTLIHCSLLN